MLWDEYMEPFEDKKMLTNSFIYKIINMVEASVIVSFSYLFLFYVLKCFCPLLIKTLTFLHFKSSYLLLRILFQFIVYLNFFTLKKFLLIQNKDTEVTSQNIWITSKELSFHISMLILSMFLFVLLPTLQKNNSDGENLDLI